MKKISRTHWLVCSCIAAVFAGLLCIQGYMKNRKPEIQVALWAFDVYDDYMKQVQSLVPDVKIKWVTGQRDIHYYKNLAEAGSLPDIITVRKFSLKDSLALNPYLLDLTKTEVASSYYDIYLEHYKTSDGTVFWVPMSGTVDGIVANKALFDAYDIPLPRDFDTFVSACREFEAHGITGYSLNISLDYNALHLLQGMGIENLTSVDGLVWRKAYENGKTNQLDPGVWLPAFEKLERLNTLKILDKDTMYLDDMHSYEKFMDGTQAMVNISSESISRLLPGQNIEILPYFGAQQDFLLTYPTFNAAINKDVEKNSKHKKAACKVLTAMTSPQAQEVLNQYTDGLISYKRDVSFQYEGSMSMVQQYLETNRTYFRLGSEDLFAFSKKALDEMIEHNLSAKSALDLMNSYMSHSE